MTTSPFPSSWIRCALGDAVDYGRVEKAEPRTIPDDAWILELEDIEKDSSKILKRVIFAERRSKSAKNRFQAGDILYGKLRPYLNKVIRAPEDGYCSTEIIPIKQTSAVDGRYLFHWLKSPIFQAYVDEVSHGLNMPRLGTEAGRVAPLVLAPLNEQRRIANKLDTILERVHACRQHLDRIPQILDHLRQSVLAAAISGTLTEIWRQEVGGSAKWERSEIQAIASVSSGATPLRSNSAFYSDSGTPWVTSGATSLPIVTSTPEFVTDEAISAYRLRVYRPGTLIVAMYGEGKTRGQVTELGISATINQACAAVSVNELLAIKDYVKIALQANYLELRKLAEGGNQPNLNLAKIRTFPIPLPPHEEQQEIVNRVSTLSQYAERIQTAYANSRIYVEKIAPVLLAKAFRGELIPQDPNDEPASMLLDRIFTTRASKSPQFHNKKSTMRVPTSKKQEVVMQKLPDIDDLHLCKILKERGPLTAEALWVASKLDIDDFYDQLKKEDSRKQLIEIRGDSPLAPRLLDVAK